MDHLIELDTRRPTEGKLETLMRRRAANTRSAPEAGFGQANAALDAAILAAPSRGWDEATDKVRFLLDRYAATPEARDARIQKLIGRAVSDLARLTKHEEHAP